MKIRSGFVSNSSSTSYVIVTTKKNYDKVLKKSDELTKYIVKEIEKIGKEVFNKLKCFNKDLIEIKYNDSDYFNIFENIDVTDFIKGLLEYEADDFDLVYKNREEKFHDFIQALKKDQKNFIEASVEGPSS
jgi:hypothetical protein